MAGTHITLTTSALEPLQERLRGIAQMDTSTLMPRLGEYLLASTQDRFATETGPDGGTWEALAPRTAARKKYNPSRVLTERGFLRKSLRYQVLDRSTVQVGTNVVYAATHQYGRGSIPARPFLGLSATDRQRILSITRSWVAEQGFK